MVLCVRDPRDENVFAQTYPESLWEKRIFYGEFKKLSTYLRFVFEFSSAYGRLLKVLVTKGCAVRINDFGIGKTDASSRSLGEMYDHDPTTRTYCG